MLQGRADNCQFAKLKIALIGLICYIAGKTAAMISRSSSIVLRMSLIVCCVLYEIYSTEPEITQYVLVVIIFYRNPLLQCTNTTLRVVRKAEEQMEQQQLKAPGEWF